jgi:hypothetical protein
MVGAELDERAKERKTRNFRQVLDFRCVRLVQELDDKIHDRNDRKAENLVAHLDSVLLEFQRTNMKEKMSSES